jgi:hypothetical protein
VNIAFVLLDKERQFKISIDVKIFSVFILSSLI